MLPIMLAVACMTAVSCVPIHVPPECQARVSDCLKDCPAGPQALVDESYGAMKNDMRTDCEKRCHEMCSGGLFQRGIDERY